MVSLCVGPYGNLHEILVEPGVDWLGELRACTQAVIDGRYREHLVQSGERVKLTMTFELPGEDLEIEHHPSVGMGFGGPGERRYSSYA